MSEGHLLDINTEQLTLLSSFYSGGLSVTIHSLPEQISVCLVLSKVSAQCRPKYIEIECTNIFGNSVTAQLPDSQLLRIPAQKYVQFTFLLIARTFLIQQL